MNNVIDITGQKFNRLLVLEFIGTRTPKGAFWKCKCDCGNVVEIRGGNLKNNHTKSCGCIRTERLVKLGKSHRKKKGESNFNSLLYGYKRLAKKRNIEFALTELEFRSLTQKYCHYCGSPPNQIHDAGGRYGAYIYNGIDRVDNFRGYVLGNCVACCGTCNVAKGTMTLKEFLHWIEKAYCYSIRDT